MRELTQNQVEFVSGAEFTWQGAAASMAAGAVTGALGGMVFGGVGAGPGALGGALLGGISYSVYELLADE